jgi:Ni,Fe-hydrogenase maturation factor
MRKRILVFGNPLVKEDALALSLIPKLQKTFPQFEFVEAEPSEVLLGKEKHLIAIDVATNINKVTIIGNLDQLDHKAKLSLHGFDLGFKLKLLKTLGRLQHVTIFAIPVHYNRKKAWLELQHAIRSTLL